MATEGFDYGRFGRLLALITFVSALFILTAAQALEGQLFRISVFAIGSVSLLTAMTGFIIAGAAAYDQQD